MSAPSLRPIREALSEPRGSKDEEGAVEGLMGCECEDGKDSRYSPAIVVPDDHAIAADTMRHIDRRECSEPECAAHRVSVLARPESYSSQYDGLSGMRR